MAQYSKQYLSGSSPAGKQIGINQSTAPGVTLHTASSSALDTDEVWLYATNNGTSVLPVVTCWGGSNSADLATTNVSPGVGRTLISDGKVAQPVSTISAYVPGVYSTAIVIDGFVNRITATSTTLDARVTNWVARVIANGGAMPSANTQAALSTFLTTLSYAGLDTLMKSVCVFVPDSLIAAVTPLIKNAGNDPWTINNFVSSDLNGNGLVGNASNKYLDTGVIANTAFGSDADGGLTLYVSKTTATASIELGALNAAGFNSHPFDLYADWSDGNTYFDCYGANAGGFGGGRVFAANSGWTGYLSGNRTATNSIAVYKASSTVSHVTLTSNTTASDQTRPTFSLFAFSTNQGGTGPANFSDKRLSFAAIHSGLTSAQSLTFYNAIQALRISLGGGYV